MLPKLIVIAGTNASGKSGLGVELALRYGGEIVSADSRQVFRGLDLGSGKITPEETRGVRHHLIDVCEAGDFFSMADFQRMAYEAIDGHCGAGEAAFFGGRHRPVRGFGGGRLRAVQPACRILPTARSWRSGPRKSSTPCWSRPCRMWRWKGATATG